MEDINSYLYLFEELKRRKKQSTLKEIGYSSEFKFGSFIKIVKRKMSFDIQRVNALCNTVVLISNLKIDEEEIVVEIYFYKRKLVFFKYIFTNLKDPSKIEELIKHKYLTSEVNVDLMTHYIEDSSGGFLFLDDEDDRGLTVSYFTGNHGFYDHVVELGNLIKNENTEEGIDNIELLGKL